MSVYQRLFSLIFRRNKYSIRHVLFLFSLIFLLWSVYRHFPGLWPVWLEELFLKPLVWLGPTFWLVRSIENSNLSSLGFSRKKIRPALIWGGGLGLIFAAEGFAASALRNQGVEFVDLSPLAMGGALIIAGATALVEETVFRGYFYSRLAKLWQDKWLANLVSALMFTALYLPAGIFVLSYRPLMMLIYLFFIFSFGLVSGFVRFKTENLLSSILLHFFWSWPSLLIG